MLDPPRDRRGERECDCDGARSGGCGDREDLQVGTHVEHHPAGGEHGAERQHDCEQAERGELRAHGRQASQGNGAEGADDERRDDDDERELNHGTNL